MSIRLTARALHTGVFFLTGVTPHQLKNDGSTDLEKQKFLAILLSSMDPMTMSCRCTKFTRFFIRIVVIEMRL
jgi:hypothetical protein